MAGARVVSTTSSQAKAQRLRELGADVVINYREEPEWGVVARKATGGAGFNHIVEVGGPGTLAQSFKAIAMEGVISIIGVLATEGEAAPAWTALWSAAITRGIMIGSRTQFEEMVRAIDANNLSPVVDDEVFGFKGLPEAYKYLRSQKHFGKVVVEV